MVSTLNWWLNGAERVKELARKVHVVNESVSAMSSYGRSGNDLLKPKLVFNR